jgi:RNA polymerase sigma factor (sigma-70 family)
MIRGQTVETTITKTDNELLGEYVESKSADAFGELAARHANWVYSCALRRVRDPHLAEDIAQAVFIILAQKARKLQANTPLNAWLFQVTRYATGHALRANARRKRHERIAANMVAEKSNPNGEAIWQQMQPWLDEVVGLLRHDDRQAILLRFYEQKSMADVGTALNVSEDAAKKRVAKALDKLRKMLERKGVVMPAAGLGIAMAVGTTQPAPATVVAACAAGTSPPASPAAQLIAKKIIAAMVTTKIKFTAAVLLLALLVPLGAVGAFLVCREPSSQWEPAGATPAIVAPTKANLEADPGLTALQGTWNPASVKVNGAEAAPRFQGGKLIIVGNNFTYFNSYWKDIATIAVNTSTSPAHLEIHENGKIYRGLYLIDHDHLKMCWSPSGGQRPEDFATYPGDDRRLVEFNRMTGATSAP